MRFARDAMGAGAGAGTSQAASYPATLGADPGLSACKLTVVQGGTPPQPAGTPSPGQFLPPFVNCGTFWNRDCDSAGQAGRSSSHTEAHQLR